jgi:hypothetical protein
VVDEIDSREARRIVVAWKDTREARRVVRDLLLFLKEAKEVMIVKVCEHVLRRKPRRIQPRS